MTGSTIGHYRVTAKIGEGGMGAVYRATDTKLQREVAVKVLLEAYASDACRMSRFAREARVLASLNHPHICSIHDVGDAAGVSYLVMELVEGRVIEGPLPVDQALKHGMQIADALDCAHRKGIIHCDLK